jgi:hypothetical protein
LATEGAESLSIERYDALEREARTVASYPALRAFSPLTFSQVNFPARVVDEQELIRYADIMYELLPRRQTLETRQYGATEAKLINQLVGQIGDVTERHFKRRIRPLMCLFPPIPILRVIEWLAAQHNRRLTVFEIGPGSGHLGAYLINCGHRYISADITQALYLWQYRLFSQIATFTEYAAMARIARLSHTQAHHVPWWHLARLHVEPLWLEADIVVCDASLGEMDSFAVPYVLKISRNILSSSEIGCFLFQNVGVENITTRVSIAAMLTSLGFHAAISGGVEVFSLKAVPLPSEIPPVGNDQELLAPLQFLNTGAGELLDSYNFFSFIGRGT